MPNCIDSEWTKKEFESINLGDKRLNKRFIKVAEQLSSQSTAPINQACDTWPDTKAAYRLFDNEKTTSKQILLCHQGAAKERLKGHEIILAAQDTTILDYTKHPKKHGMGPIGKENEKTHGLIMHTTLAMTLGGMPLGILDQDIWSRNEEEKGCSEKRKERPIEEKESNKWLISLEKTAEFSMDGPKIVTVCDREADIFEFFMKARELNAPILVRAAQNRIILEEVGKLWDYMDSQPVAGVHTIEIPGKNSKRKANLEIRFASVTIKPPGQLKRFYKENIEPIVIDAVWVKEFNVSDGEEAIEWMLLTNEKVKTFSDALEKLDWYKKRWCVEEFHKVLKSGCTVESCRLEKSERLLPFLTLCSVIAWRLLWIVKINRERPEAPCTEILTNYEWQALYCKIHKTTELPEEVPTVRESVRWIGQLGGFLGRKRDKEPGITVIWRGWQRLMDIVEAWLIFYPA